MSDTLLSLGQAARLVPARGGKRTSSTTLWRWIVRGYRGIHLEASRRPDGMYLTTEAAVQRFLEAVANGSRVEPAPTPATLARQIRTRAILEANGIRVGGPVD